MRPFVRKLIAFLQTTAFLGIAVIGSAVTACAQQADDLLLKSYQAISTERILADIRTLTDPSFNGRQTGTEDDLRSAQWIAQEFLSAGLRLPNIRHSSLLLPFAGGKHGGSSGIMAAPVTAVTISPDPVLRIGTADQLAIQHLGMDYLPVFDAPSAEVQGQIAFVGYGIVDPSQGINDYADVDVNNRVVLFLRGKPDHYQRTVSHAEKVRWARERGALAYLTATGPVLHPYEARRGVTGRPAAIYGQLPPEQAIPGAWITTTLAERIVGAEGVRPDQLRILQQRLNQAPSVQSHPTPHYALLHWKATTQEGVLANVVGLVPGTGLEAVVIGAHRDHFGRPAGLLFPGADDNASGTAVILEVARALTKAGFRPRRTVLFVSFSGEERDLLGARLYTSRPLVPLDSTKGMINVDHAGIGNGRLTVGVTGIEKNVAKEAGQLAGAADKLDVFGFFPGGDHVPFKEAGVPTVTVVSGGIHPHFHQPTDTAETLDPDILQTVARYVLALTWQLANDP